MKNKIAMSLVLGVIITSSVGCGQSWERTKKNISSEYGGGLNRTVTVYDQQGNSIQTYEGNIDIRDTEYGNKVLFDLDGKRIVIYNAVVIAEEN